jgi:cytochrome c556
LYAVATLTLVGAGASGPARAGGLDPIAIRQVGMDLCAGNFAYIKSVVKAEADVKQLEHPAMALARWGKTIPAVFPAGSDKGENTKARPDIWSDNAAFVKAADNMSSAASKLAEDAKAGNADAVPADAKLVGEACGACHRHFRAR